MDISNGDIRIRALNENLTNIKAMKYLIEHLFGELKVNSIEVIGSGNISVAYLVNNEYIFKTKFNVDKKNSYEKEKAIYDFLNDNLDTNIQIPKIEFSCITDNLSIMGYKKINGKFLTPELYFSLTEEEQVILKTDIANFLNKLHSLDFSLINQYKIDCKKNMLDDCEILKETIYDKLTKEEQEYVESFINKLMSIDIFNDKKCLCHNDFSCNHLLLDGANKLSGIIDFGDAGITDEYFDFIYLLEDSEEEIGHLFGEDIIKLYGSIDCIKAKEYQKLVDEFYPIEIISYGIKNNDQSFIEEGRSELLDRSKTEC